MESAAGSISQVRESAPNCANWQSDGIPSFDRSRYLKARRAHAFGAYATRSCISRAHFQSYRLLRSISRTAGRRDQRGGWRQERGMVECATSEAGRAHDQRAGLPSRSRWRARAAWWKPGLPRRPASATHAVLPMGSISAVCLF